MVTVSRYCSLLAACLLLGACASPRGNTPSLPWLIAATVRSLAGMPPNHPDYHAEPVRVSDTLKLTAITAGRVHTCALNVDGDAYCWGANEYQQLGNAELTETCGNGTFTCSSVPVRVEDAPRFTVLAASARGTCGLDGFGAAHCWGFGFGGTAADGSLASSSTPIEIPGGHRFVALNSSPDGLRTCGLTADGRAWCWGFESPEGGGPHVFVGPDLLAAGSAFVAIDVGGGHGCGIDAGRNASCWGANQFGQLGTGLSGLDGGVGESPVPVAVQGGLAVERVAAASSYSCGLDTEGSLHCWGSGFPPEPYTRVPDRRTIAHGALPVRLWTTDPKWVEIGAGASETCGMTADGGLYCFTATFTARDARPSRIESEQAFVAFAVGGSHTCAIGADGHAYCWGMSNVGQVGRPPRG